MNLPGGVVPPKQGQRRHGRGIRSTWQDLWSRWLGPARLRLAVLVLVAAIPLLALSATIALQNYHLALAASGDTAIRLRDAAVARHISAVAGTEQMLQALANMPELVSGDLNECEARLARVLTLQAAHFSNIAVATATGERRCSARPLSPALMTPAATAFSHALYARAASRHGFVLGPIFHSPFTAADIIPAAYPLLESGTIVGFLSVGIRIEWLYSGIDAQAANPFAIWLVDGAGHIARPAAAGASELPLEPLLGELETRFDIVDALSSGGFHFAYASAVLGDGYTLIVGYPAAADRQLATSLLIRRVGQLSLLLLLGLAAVAVGTHLALVEPLDELSKSIARWRDTGRFDASVLRYPPAEVREMAETFAEATRAIADHAARHQIAVAQQELLMREIHHRVKNNLQIVASLLNLQASRIRLPEARAEFASARDRVRALATLHRHLYMQGEVHTIDMPSFLTELCNQLFQAMGETPGQRIGLIIEASPLQMSSDQAVPLSLVVTEAVSNAVKYAFPGGRTGEISVVLKSDGETADLCVEDDGVGIPAGRIETETGPRDGIGISLIRGFARQLGATLTVHEDFGTRYALRMPLRQATSNPEIAA